MVKAIIEKVENNGYLYRVRIPVYHKIENTPGGTKSADLPVATVCTSPGILPSYQVGDVVWVEFENNELGKPVIVGLLYRSEMSESSSDFVCNVIQVNSSAELPQETKIGDVGNSIQSLPQILQNLNNLDNMNLSEYFEIDDDGHLRLYRSEYLFEIDDDGHLQVYEPTEEED